MNNETKVKVVTADPSALGLFGISNNNISSFISKTWIN